MLISFILVVFKWDLRKILDGRISLGLGKILVMKFKEVIGCRIYICFFFLKRIVDIIVIG